MHMQTKLLANGYTTNETIKIADNLMQSAICWSLLRGCTYIVGAECCLNNKE